MKKKMTSNDVMNFIHNNMNKIKYEPEVDINEDANTLWLCDYNEMYGQSNSVMEICSADQVDLKDLRKKLNSKRIAYVF